MKPISELFENGEGWDTIPVTKSVDLVLMPGNGKYNKSLAFKVGHKTIITVRTLTALTEMVNKDGFDKILETVNKLNGNGNRKTETTTKTLL